MLVERWQAARTERGENSAVNFVLDSSVAQEPLGAISSKES